MKMDTRNKILILSSLIPSTGNLQTAYRVAGHFGVKNVLLLDINYVKDPHEMEDYLVKHKDVAWIVGIHVYKAGRLLIGCSLPYILIFGGTDININSLNPPEMKIMNEAIHNAGVVVTFSHEMTKRAKKMWPRNKFTMIRPSIPIVTLPPRIRPADEYSIVLCASIRPVKGIVWAIEAMRECPDYTLNIYGPMLDIDYHQLCQEKLRDTPNAHYCGIVEHSSMLSIIKEADLVINTSQSEGVCTAILEAMSLKSVVLARNIPSNEELIMEGINGFLFNSLDEFIEKLNYTQQMNELSRRRMGEVAQRYVKNFHGLDKERNNYRLLRHKYN